MVPLTTVLFDMDNTLFDLRDAQVTACSAVAESLGRSDGEELFRDYFCSGVHGYESHENIRSYLADRSCMDEGEFARARRVYEQVKIDRIVAYSGVPETLAVLKKEGYNMAVITDAHSFQAMRRLEKTRLFGFFDSVVTFDMVKVKKPDPGPFLAALDMMKARPQNALLVGDSPRRDICPARELGIRTVYARYGDLPSAGQDCSGADYVIDSMNGLLPILESFRSEKM
jgi:putative hydrolase of the HAD superfamily